MAHYADKLRVTFEDDHVVFSVRESDEKVLAFRISYERYEEIAADRAGSEGKDFGVSFMMNENVTVHFRIPTGEFDRYHAAYRLRG